MKNEKKIINYIQGNITELKENYFNAQLGMTLIIGADFNEVVPRGTIANEKELAIEINYDPTVPASDICTEDFETFLLNELA